MLHSRRHTGSVLESAGVWPRADRCLPADFELTCLQEEQSYRDAAVDPLRLLAAIYRPLGTQ